MEHDEAMGPALDVEALQLLDGEEASLGTGHCTITCGDTCRLTCVVTS